MKYLRVILIVLLLGCCTLWVASYWWITWLNYDGRFMWLLRDGNFWIQIYKPGQVHYNYSGTSMPYGLAIDGYDGLTTRWTPVLWFYTNPYSWSLQGAFWLPTLLLALPLAISANPWARRRRRATQGLCVRCGYDLSGTDHEACPECGDPTSRARQ